MSVLEKMRRAVFGATIRVHLIVRGRIGEGWYDFDRKVRLPEGATLGDLIERAERQGAALEHALAHSPHLRDTLMHNGERCPVQSNRQRILADGDEVYLLAPLAGG